jgi:hypothetical protein
MSALGTLAGGVGAALLGLMLLAQLPHAEAKSSAVPLHSGRKPSPYFASPGFPSAGRSLYAPPAFTDPSAPISERPFAKPFTDRSPSIADRPLPSIGGGTRLAPDAPPPVWCQGRRMKADHPWRGCPPW